MTAHEPTEPERHPSALTELGHNVRRIPVLAWRGLAGLAKARTDRTRVSFVSGNLFLHVHSPRVHRWTLRWATTWGLGIITLAAFLLTVITGIMLMFYYKPDVASAYDSIKDIHFVVPSGRFMRNVHRWAGNVMVVGVFLHMARVFFVAAYRAPRQLNWVIGMLLLVMTLGLAFTGYLLPWDQLAYWAVTIGSNIAESPRELTDALGITQHFDPGGFQKAILLGSDQVGAESLIRFYLLHVMILPVALTTLLGVHFWRVRKDGGLARPANADDLVEAESADVHPVFTQTPKRTYGLAALVKGRTPKVEEGPEHTVPSMPHLLQAELALFMLTCAICLILAVVWDAPLKELANPAVPENPAKAPWYFLGLQELVGFSALMGGIGIPTIVLLGLGLVPWLDREREGTGQWFGGPGGGKLVLWSAVFGLAAVLIVETVAIRYGWLRQWFPDIPQLVIVFVNPGTVLTAIYAGYSVWLVKHYDSTRAGALGLFVCFLAGFIVLTVIGLYFRGPNWHFYWSPSDWPGH